MVFLYISYLILATILVTNLCISESSNKCSRNKTLQVLTWYGKNSYIELIQGCTNDPEITKLVLQDKTVVLEPFTFVDMTKLKSLSLQNKYLQQLKPSFVVNASNLENIYARGNLIKVIEYGVFNEMNLENLILGSNLIQTIAEGAFANMSATLLYLGNNRLWNLNSSWFGNSYIEKLDLSYNRIRKINKDSFDEVKNLVFINLNYNKISTIEDETFSGHENLMDLHLAGNLLKRLDFLSGVWTLNKLDVGFNNIGYIDLENRTNISQILIYPNPWSCQCLEKFWQYAWENDVQYGGSTTSRIPIEIGQRPLCLLSTKECDYTYNNVLADRYMNFVNYEQLGRYKYNAYYSDPL